MRKELVRPDRSEVTGGDAFKFRHILIRDAAYAALPKRERAELHQRFADWLEKLTADGAIELSEIIGYHLAEAHRYQTELGLPASELGGRAADVLSNAAGRAAGRGDFQGSASLFTRAAQAAPTRERQLQMQEHALWARRRDLAGTSLREIWVAASDAATQAKEAGLKALALRLSLLAGDTLTYVDVSAWSSLERLLPEALAVFGSVGDERGIALAKYVEAGRDQVAMRFDRAYEAMSESLEIAQRTGWQALGGLVAMNQSVSGEYGSTPIEKLRSSIKKANASGPVPMALIAGVEANLSLLADGYEKSQPKLEAAQTLLAQYGGGMRSGITLFWAMYASWTGDLHAAEEMAREAEAALRTDENEYGRRTAAGIIAFCLAARGQFDEAEPYQRDAAGADINDPATHLIALRTAAVIDLGRGDVAAAERSCITAMELLDGTEAAMDRAETLFILADVKRAMGQVDLAVDALREAHEMMMKKGATAVARKIARRLEQVEPKKTSQATIT